MGHTLTASGEAPEATRYYSQMTENQKAEIRHDTILAIMDDARLAVRVIDPEEEAERLERIMAEADERTREVLERYGGLHPVTFGHCGYPGLCVRGTARSFCLGCPFLVRRPEYLDPVDFLLDSYLTAADAHERMGDLAPDGTARGCTGFGLKLTGDFNGQLTEAVATEWHVAITRT
jgi:hypothetical protein